MKKVIKLIESVDEVDIEYAVKDFFRTGYWTLQSWEETEIYVDSYIDDFVEISDKEETELKREIHKEFDKRVAELISKEKEKLKDRKSIIDWFEECYPEEGEVGYLLSTEEILDLILENGNK